MSLDTIQPYHGSYLMPSLEHATVSDAMHPGILSCRPDASATEMARMMATHHVHCIAVSGRSRDPSGESRIWGIISDLDLIQAGIENDSDQAATTLARQPVITVKPATALREAARLMLDHDAHHIVVVDPNTRRPVGILSTLDVAEILAWGEG